MTLAELISALAKVAMMTNDSGEGCKVKFSSEGGEFTLKSISAESTLEANFPERGVLEEVPEWDETVLLQFVPKE